MGHIDATTTLSATPAELWAVISDPQTWGDWFTIHERWLEEPPADLAAGTKLTAKIVMLGMANKIEWTVREVDAPARMVLSGTGMAGVKTEFTFALSEVEGGTTLDVSGDFEGSLIKGALAKAVEKDGRNQLDKTLAKLDELAAAKA